MNPNPNPNPNQATTSTSKAATHVLSRCTCKGVWASRSIRLPTGRTRGCLTRCTCRCAANPYPGPNPYPDPNPSPDPDPSPDPNPNPDPNPKQVRRNAQAAALKTRDFTICIESCDKVPTLYP
eukprot:scaffold3238_cov60-Phaeocystis_antarctica.AAC.4